VAIRGEDNDIWLGQSRNIGRSAIRPMFVAASLKWLIHVSKIWRNEVIIRLPYFLSSLPKKIS
jgi:hypothetical protein